MKKNGRRHDGVRNLLQLRERCRIDAETGCWIWCGAMAVAKTRKVSPTTRVWLPDGLPGGGEPVVTTAGKAAWVLSGKPLPAGHVVWRHLCTNTECVNPYHAAAGTRPEMFAAIAASGRLKGDPARAALCTKARLAMVTPVEVVRQAESMFEAGTLQKDVMAALGIWHETARAIRLGKHPHSAAKQRLVRGASVFTLGASA